MDECRDRPRKYFYLRGHSGTLPGFPRIEAVPRVSYINVVDPDSLCHINDLSVRSITLFASYSPREREHNLQSFMRHLRTHSTDFHLRDSIMFPARAQTATNQRFEFFHGPTADTSPYPSYITSMGIWDLDQLSSRTTSLSKPSILGESLQKFFGSALPKNERILTLENIRNMLMDRYPEHCIVIIMAGCRLEQTPSRQAASHAASRAPAGSVEQREARATASMQRPADQITGAQLTDAMANMSISGTSIEAMVSSEGDDGSADTLRVNPDDSRQSERMEWSNPYTGRDFDTDMRNKIDPFTRKRGETEESQRPKKRRGGKKMVKKATTRKKRGQKHRRSKKKTRRRCKKAKSC